MAKITVCTNEGEVIDQITDIESFNLTKMGPQAIMFEVMRLLEIATKKEESENE